MNESLFHVIIESVGEAILKSGKHDREAYWYKPTAQGQRLQEQLEKYENSKVVDILDALNEAAQQNLIGVNERLVSVDAPPWLTVADKPVPVIAPRPAFEKLD